jgi:hypothetical protein
MCLREVPGATGAVCCSVDVLRHPPERKKNVSQVRPTAADPDGTGQDGRRKNANSVTTTTKNQYTGGIGAGITTADAGVVGWPRAGAGYVTTTTNTVGLAWATLHCTVHVYYCVAVCRMSWVTSCSRRKLTIHPGK